jgi:trehalose 6-phosphate synthase
MRQLLHAGRFIGALILGLGILAWLASLAVTHTTRAWFEKDMSLRAQLAVNGARPALVARWREPSQENLGELLADWVRDERIRAAALCGMDLSFLARTEAFPDALDCRELGARVGPVAADSTDSSWTVWSGVERFSEGRMHVTAIPVLDGQAPLGFAVLVHDLGYADRREAKTQGSLLALFGFLGLAASAVTLLAARFSWRGWSYALRSSLRGETERPEFAPILQDVRELVDRLIAETHSDEEGAAWTPERLRHTLQRHLHGEKVVVIANREPYIHMRTPAGGIEVVHPASGLVTALEPVMRACSGTWIAHGSGSADRESSDLEGRVRVPPGEESYVLRRVWLSAEEEKGYYYGFANEGLWPLCHIAHARPEFRSDDWRHYCTVSERFAEVLCKEVDCDDPIVLVQDYHFALLPQLIRARLPRATILMFWHVPWPNAERFGICPRRTELLEGMLGASIVGFHTQLHCNNFVDCVERYLEARTDREDHALVQRGRRTLVRPYPISLEWPVHWAQGAADAASCRAEIFRELGLAPDALLGVGVDRLDYTKGLEERLRAVERLLECHPRFRGRFTFVQLAAPSRTAIERYRELSASIERLAERIQERFGSPSYRPVILLRSHHEPPEVFRYYRAADLCYVSSLHDGMNLVAKEFVAAREDEAGVLVLSQFTGAARELTEALIVNPYDLDEASSALAAALELSAAEQRDRMRAMRAFVAEFNVYRWAGRMLVDAARLRRRERLSGRLTDPAEAQVKS